MCVEVPSTSTVQVTSMFVLQPQHTAAGTTHTMEGVGVGEVGGAHWFASSEGPSECATNSACDYVPLDQPRNSEGTIGVSAQFTVSSSGAIAMCWEFDTTHALPSQLAPGLTPSLARVGLQWRVSRNLSRATWYGLGPHECYPDRRASAQLLQHSK
jgi:beta-galactosidase